MLAHPGLDDLGDRLRMQPAADLATLGHAAEDWFTGFNARGLDPGFDGTDGIGVLGAWHGDDLRFPR